MYSNYNFYTYKNFKVNYLNQKKQLSIKEYDDSIIVPVNCSEALGGGVIAENAFVENTGRRKLGAGYTNYKHVFVNPDEKQDITVLYIGYLNYHFGHMIVDSSIRLWAIDKYKYDKIAYISSDKGELPTYYQELFIALHIQPEKMLRVDKITRFKKVCVPDLSYLVNVYVSEEFCKPFNDVIHSLANEFKDKYCYNKIYFSRTHFVKKNNLMQYGEVVIEKIFEQNGFKVLYPEELKLHETIYYMQNCSILATGVGTLSHNIIFARDKIELILLNRYENTYLMHQVPIDMVKKANVTVIDIFSRLSEKNFSYVYLNNKLKKFLIENKMKYNIKFYDKVLSIFEYFYFVQRIIRIKMKIKSRVNNFVNYIRIRKNDK